MAKAVVLKIIEEYFGDMLDIKRENLKLGLWKGQVGFQSNKFSTNTHTCFQVKLQNVKFNHQVRGNKLRASYFR